MRLRKRQRILLVLLVLLLSGGASALVLTALQSKIAFFVSPSDLAQGKIAAGRELRIGGLVAAGSIRQGADGGVRFVLTDEKHQVPVVFRGILPDLFREGQGIIAEGTVDRAGVFEASEVLAKHDERYMPKDVAEALKRSGRWNEGEATAAQ
jgi:cytochrome c-type biogenesis protein CcmE